jgi:hypothetical protein
LDLEVRHGEGLDEAKLSSTIEALNDCRQAWRGRDEIPRAAVNVMVDMHIALESSADRYPEDERLGIINAALQIGDALRAAVAIEG